MGFCCLHGFHSRACCLAVQIGFWGFLLRTGTNALLIQVGGFSWWVGNAGNRKWQPPNWRRASRVAILSSVRFLCLLVRRTRLLVCSAAGERAELESSFGHCTFSASLSLPTSMRLLGGPVVNKHIEANRLNAVKSTPEGRRWRPAHIQALELVVSELQPWSQGLVGPMSRDPS